METLLAITVIDIDGGVAGRGQALLPLIPIMLCQGLLGSFRVNLSTTCHIRPHNLPSDHKGGIIL